MKHELVYINEYRMSLDYSVEANVKSFKEEVRDRLGFIHKTYSVNDLLFSGGMDSTLILRSLLDLGITPYIHTLSFSKSQTDYGSLRAKEQCKKFGVKEPKFFYLDKDDFFRHVDFLTYEKEIAYPTLHCYYMDYYLAKTEGKKFFCGMACEYRTSKGVITMNVAPPAIKQGNPDRLYGFECSETFFAFINEPVFKNNYLKDNPILKPPYGENIWRVRDLIYNKCYPEIEITDKRTQEDDYLTGPFNKDFMPKIWSAHPAIFLMKPYRFNAQEYLNRKAHKTLEERKAA